MTTLEERRHQADMLYVYKILTGRENVDRSEWFTTAAEASRATRSTAHGLNIRVKHGRLEVRRNSFSVRVSAQWNEVPGVIKDMRTIDGFSPGQHMPGIAKTLPRGANHHLASLL